MVSSSNRQPKGRAFVKILLRAWPGAPFWVSRGTSGLSWWVSGDHATPWLQASAAGVWLCSWLPGLQPDPGPVCCRDVLALPIFKQEEPQLSPENEARLPPLQYVLCAATSPAVKLHEETLTYLNQGRARPGHTWRVGSLCGQASRCQWGWRPGTGAQLLFPGCTPLPPALAVFMGWNTGFVVTHPEQNSPCMSPPNVPFTGGSYRLELLLPAHDRCHMWA